MVDNTNPTAAERAAYVGPARDARFRVVGYVFDVMPREAIRRNQARPEHEQVPIGGVLGTFKRLEPPRPEEGFAELHRVRIKRDRGFVVDSLGSP